MTLPEFLAARLAEREAEMRQVIGYLQNTGDWRTARLVGKSVAEIEAQQNVLTYAGLIAEDPTLPSTRLARHILGDLALPFAGHHDYREEWRP